MITEKEPLSGWYATVMDPTGHNVFNVLLKRSEKNTLDRNIWELKGGHNAVYGIDSQNTNAYVSLQTKERQLMKRKSFCHMQCIACKIPKPPRAYSLYVYLFIIVKEYTC